MWEVQAALEVFQTVLALASGVYFVGARFKQVETREPDTAPFIWLLAAMLLVSTAELAILIVWTGWVPDLLPLATVLLQILALAIQIDQLYPCIAEDKEDRKPIWHAYLGSWITMAVADTLAIVRLALMARSLTFDVVYTGMAASLRCFLELTLLAIFSRANVEGYIQLGDDIETGTTTAGNNSNSEETERPEPPVLQQSVRDEIRATGGLWPWLKKFHIFLPWVWPSSKLQQLFILSALALKLGETALELIIPRCEAGFIESLIQAFNDREPGSALPALALYMAVGFLSSPYGLPTLRSLLWKEVDIHRNERVQLSIYAHLMKHEAAFHNSNNSKDIETSVDMGSTVCQTLDFIVLTTLPQIIKLVSSGFTIFSRYGTHVALVQIFVIIVSIIIILRSQRVLVTLHDAKRTIAQESRRRRQGTLQAFSTIAVHGQTDHEIDAYAKILGTEMELSRKASVSMSMYCSYLGIVSDVGKCVTMVFVFVHALRTGGTVGHVVAFLRYWDLLEGPLLHVVGIPERILKELYTAARLRRIMETKPKMEYGTEDLHLTGGGIKFKNVSFRYPNSTRLVLRNLSFDVEPKKTTAFVGPSGVGKSTIQYLIARLFEPTEGSIEIDGQDIKMLKRGV
ncbi:ATP-binding cassette sub-family B member 6, mitochondrial [Ilyonectria robusta]